MPRQGHSLYLLGGKSSKNLVNPKGIIEGYTGFTPVMTRYYMVFYYGIKGIIER